MKKVITMITIVLLLILTVGCQPKVPQSIEISGDAIVELKGTAQYQATVLPKGAPQAVNWTTSDPDIATITNEGLLTTAKLGTVTIIATAVSNELVFGELTIEVALLKVVGQRNLKLGEVVDFMVNVTSSTLTTAVNWTSQNDAIATVSASGTVTGVAKGETVIIATSQDDATVICEYPVRVTNADNSEFDTLLDQLFIDMMGTDPMNINFSLYEPEDYGLEDCVVEPYTFSPEEEAEYFQELKDMKTSLNNFADDVLSEEQLLDKQVLIDYLDHQLAYEGFYYFGSNLGSYLGYQAQLPIILAEYRFDDRTDIENYFDYLEATDDTFANIVAFEKEKATQGMGLTDIIIDRVIEQCDAFIDAEECYLIPVFESKVDELTFLSEQEKLDYKTQNETLVVNSFVNAYVELKTELLTMKGQNTGSGALASFTNGPEYYQVLFQDNIGTDMTIPEVKTYLTNILTNMMNSYRANSANYSRDYNNTDLMGSMTINDLIPFFLTSMEDEFPSLGFTPDYDIKSIHESLQEHSSPAMYFLSPLDGNRTESIYINPLNFTDLDNYTYQTIAHEGTPGHLYQHVYLKNTDLPLVRKNLSVTGYAEGWTTYIENYILKYNTYGSRASVMKAFEFYDSASYIILGLADIGVNYEGWDITETVNFVGQYFTITEEEVTDIYYDLTEIPTNYLQYYFSYYQVKDLKSSFKLAMGSEYSDYLFHKIYLETGPTSFTILKQQYEKYAEDYAGN